MVSVRVKLGASKYEPQFPKMSEDVIRNITIGAYQLKMSHIYTQEHLNDNCDYVIMVNNCVSEFRYRAGTPHRRRACYGYNMTRHMLPTSIVSVMLELESSVRVNMYLRMVLCFCQKQIFYQWRHKLGRSVERCGYNPVTSQFYSFNAFWLHS